MALTSLLLLGLLLLLQLLTAQGQDVESDGLDQDVQSGRVMGGYAPVPHFISYMVSMQTTERQHKCGGTLIHKYWVLSAAHCNFGLDQMRIVAGDYSLSIYEGTEQELLVDHVIPHPDYNPANNNNDIMLIKLKMPVTLNSYVSIALLPRYNGSIAEGRMCRVSGWGYTKFKGGQIPSTLLTVKIPIVSNENCNNPNSFNGAITDTMICAGYGEGGKDACTGDSGGPLVCDGRVYGVVSWGVGCGEPNYPGVYAAVSKFRRWIDKTIFSHHGRCKDI